MVVPKILAPPVAVCPSLYNTSLTCSGSISLCCVAPDPTCVFPSAFGLALRACLRLRSYLHLLQLRLFGCSGGPNPSSEGSPVVVERIKDCSKGSAFVECFKTLLRQPPSTPPSSTSSRTFIDSGSTPFQQYPKPAMVVPTPPPYSGMHLGGSLSSSGDDNEAILGSPEVNLLAPLPSLQTDP